MMIQNSLHSLRDIRAEGQILAGEDVVDVYLLLLIKKDILNCWLRSEYQFEFSVWVARKLAPDTSSRQSASEYIGTIKRVSRRAF